MAEDYDGIHHVIQEDAMPKDKFVNMPLTTLLGIAKGVSDEYRTKPEMNLTATGDMIRALTKWIEYYMAVSDR